MQNSQIKKSVFKHKKLVHKSRKSDLKTSKKRNNTENNIISEKRKSNKKVPIVPFNINVQETRYNADKSEIKISEKQKTAYKIKKLIILLRKTQP